jgi:hypothetical protein
MQFVQVCIECVTGSHAGCTALAPEHISAHAEAGQQHTCRAKEIAVQVMHTLSCLLMC